MGSACGGSKEDNRLDIMTNVKDAKWDGRSETFLCDAPYKKAIKLWRFDKVPDFMPPGAIGSFEADGNCAGATRKVTFGEGIYLEEVCTFWQPNAHGYIVTIGGEPGNATAMIAEKGNFVLSEVPGDPSKFLATITVSYQTTDPKVSAAVIQQKF